MRRWRRTSLSGSQKISRLELQCLLVSNRDFRPPLAARKLAAAAVQDGDHRGDSPEDDEDENNDPEKKQSHELNSGSPKNWQPIHYFLHISRIAIVPIDIWPDLGLRTSVWRFVQLSNLCQGFLLIILFFMSIKTAPKDRSRQISDDCKKFTTWRLKQPRSCINFNQFRSVTLCRWRLKNLWKMNFSIS